MNKKVKIPKVPFWLFERFIPFYDHDNFICDIKEVYNLIYKEKGKPKANCWLRSHFLRSLPSFIYNNFDPV